MGTFVSTSSDAESKLSIAQRKESARSFFKDLKLRFDENIAQPTPSTADFERLQKWADIMPEGKALQSNNDK